MIWDSQYYFHTALPFGLKSSCAIWERYSTAAEQIAKNNGVKHLIHYIDDYFGAQPTAPIAKATLDLIIALFNKLGLPLSQDKIEGPLQVMKFLGITIDTVAKLDEIRRKSATRNQHHIAFMERPYNLRNQRITITGWIT
jgi:hypothetical protein